MLEALQLLEIVVTCLVNWRFMLPTLAAALIGVPMIITTPDLVLGVVLGVATILLGMLIGWRWQDSAKPGRR